MSRRVGRGNTEEDKLKRLCGRVLEKERGQCTFTANLRLDSTYGMRVRSEDVNHEYSSDGSLLYVYIENVQMRKMAGQTTAPQPLSSSSSSSSKGGQSKLASYADALRANFRAL